MGVETSLALMDDRYPEYLDEARWSTKPVAIDGVAPEFKMMSIKLFGLISSWTQDAPSPSAVKNAGNFDNPDSGDADRDVELVEDVPDPSGKVALAEPEEPDAEMKRDLGKQTLIREVASSEHMLPYVPKNQYCDVCNRAKRFKPFARANGGSSQVQSESFGQHITGDFPLTRSEPEIGIDGDKVAIGHEGCPFGFQVCLSNSAEQLSKCIFGVQTCCWPGGSSWGLLQR